MPAVDPNGRRTTPTFDDLVGTQKNPIDGPPAPPPAAPASPPSAPVNPQNLTALASQNVYNQNEFNQQEIQQYEQDIFNMSTAGRPNDGQLILPPGVGAGEFATLESNLEQFAASAGWRYYPTSSQVTQMLQQGLGTADQQQVFQWLSKVNGVAAAMPWAATGQTKTQYDNQKDTLQAQLAEYTGDPSMYGELVQQAMSHGSSASSWLTTQLTTNTAYTKNAKTPWLQYGMTYSSFKQQAAQSAGKIRSIYGANATLAQQAEALGAPKEYSSGAAGSAVTTPSTSSGPLVTPGGRSSVR